MEIPREKATFDDFLACMYLANIQFHGARFVFRKLRTQWFDEALTKSTRFLEKFYLPFLIWLAGLAMVAAIGVESLDGMTLLLLMVAWTAADILLISPLLYFLVVPKPVRKHIKDIRNLTPYERRVRERQLNENPRLERLMKKYARSGEKTEETEGGGKRV